MARPGQGQLHRGFRSTAQVAITILRPTGRAGRMQSTARVVYEPHEQLKCVWVTPRVAAENSAGGERQWADTILLIRSSDLQQPLSPECRILRGHIATGDNWNASDEWLVLEPGPESERGDFRLTEVAIRQVPTGGRSVGG